MKKRSVQTNGTWENKGKSLDRSECNLKINWKNNLERNRGHQHDRERNYDVKYLRTSSHERADKFWRRKLRK